jgi:hypothetical protein
MFRITTKLIALALLCLISFSPFAQQPFIHSTNSSNIRGHMTDINHSSVNGNPNALLFVTQHYGQYNDHQIGVWYNSGKWTIYNEDKKAMPNGTKFNVISVSPSNNAFQHKAQGGNIRGNSTIINHPATNNNPNAILFITQNWTGSYNPKALGVWYNGSNWAIFNQDRSAMPNGANFNVLVLNQGFVSELNANVSIESATDAGKKNQWGPYLTTTSLTDPTAILLTTQNWQTNGPYNPHVTAVWFGGNSWTIYNEDKQPMATNAKFNTLNFGKAAQANAATKETPGNKKKKSQVEQMADEIGKFIKDAKKNNN